MNEEVSSEEVILKHIMYRDKPITLKESIDSCKGCYFYIEDKDTCTNSDDSLPDCYDDESFSIFVKKESK